MASGKYPARELDGPFASWMAQDESGQFSLTNGSIIQLGQPVCIDVTQFGPDNNVPNNGAAPPLCERLVATTSANAGPLFGVVTNANAPSGLTYSTVNGIPQWKNTSSGTIVVTVDVRQIGWAYVLAGTAAIGQTGGNSILVGSNLIQTSAQVFAIQGSVAAGSNIGTALATVINTSQKAPGAPAAAGVISVLPNNMVGIVPNALVLIDALASGVQEQVSVGSISGPTFAVAIVNAHPAGFKITGPAVPPSKNSVLISTPGAGITNVGLVATLVNIWA